MRVSLGRRSYPIAIGIGLLQRSGAMLKNHVRSKNVVIITDSHVAGFYLRTVERSLHNSGFIVHSIVIPPGERQKNLQRAESIYTQLLKWKIDRSATMIALGGGVIGDLAGFVAATYQRGVGFVQIPTTLLAQVDSSVGGKVGVNHPMAKNMIGAFYQPQFVIADISVLRTLPKRELICGLGEVIKYGIILDKKFFAFTEKNLTKAINGDPDILRTMVKRCCQIKSYVVSHDERESGLRAILNFGHTIGHAVEHAGHYSFLKHGEAVLYGMIAETYIAHMQAMISKATKEQIVHLISAVPLPKLSALNISFLTMLDTMVMDKKTKDGKIRMVLPSSIGKVSLPIPVSTGSIRKALTYLKEYAS